GADAPRRCHSSAGGSREDHAVAEQHDDAHPLTAEHIPARTPMDEAFAPASHAAVSPREARRQAKQQHRLETLERKQLHRAEKAARGPGAWRTWVLPMLKIGVAAIIAIALVKLAFFPSGEPAVADDPMAGAMFDEPVAMV